MKNNIEKKIWDTANRMVNRMPKEMRTAQRIVIGRGNINIVWIKLKNGYTIQSLHNGETVADSVRFVAKDALNATFRCDPNDDRQVIDATIRGNLIKATSFTYYQDHTELFEGFYGPGVFSFTDFVKSALSDASTEKGSYLIVECTSDPDCSGILTLEEEGYENWNEYFDEVKAEVNNSNYCEYYYTQDGMILTINGKRSVKFTIFNN